MGLQAVPGFIGQAGYNHPPELMRNIMKALTDAGTGLLSSTNGFAMTASGSVMQLTMAPGFAVLLGQESSAQGSYFVWSDANQVLNWPAHGGSNRMDSLILRVIDTQYGADADTPQAEWEIITGTSAVAIPDIEFQSGGDFYRPGAWWRVADVLVQSTDLNMAATDITDYRKLATTNLQRLDAGGMFWQRVTYQASSTFTKANYPNLKKVNVKVVGAGGGGGSSGTAAASQSTTAAGGGGGGYAESWISAASLGSTVTVTVGAAGTAGAAGSVGANGGTGGTSSFGTAVVATGGQGGNGASGSSTTPAEFLGGAGGAGTAGDLQITGGPGGTAWKNNTLSAGGTGGDAGFGMGGGAIGTRIGAAAASAGTNGGNYGGGGGGSCAGNTASGLAGGAGAPGIVIVDVYV